CGSKGASLVEAVLAVGVLALAVPLVFAAMAESGESVLAAQAETRSSWIVSACLEELHLARNGQSIHLPEMIPSEDFPSGGGVVALAFSAEGAMAGKVGREAYDRGLREIEGRSVRYVVSMTGARSEANATGACRCLDVVITLEYPAAAP